MTAIKFSVKSKHYMLLVLKVQKTPQKKPMKKDDLKFEEDHLIFGDGGPVTTWYYK